MSTFGRIRVWYASLLLSVSLFSLWMSSSSFFSMLAFSPLSVFRMASSPASLLGLVFHIVGSSFFIFALTMIFALPVWFLYLPFVVAVKDAEGWRLWTTLVSGILIGPASLALWGLAQGLALQRRGADVRLLWHGDGIGPGIEQCMIFALVVGFLTSAFYVFALKTDSQKRMGSTRLGRQILF